VAVGAEVLVDKGAPPRVMRLIVSADCGRLINPDSVRAQLESAVIFWLSAALSGKASFAGGEAQALNFDTSPLLGLAETPAIEIMLIDSAAAPGGVGEVGTPPVAPAVANALFAASGERRRSLPLGAPVGQKAPRTGVSVGTEGPLGEDAGGAEGAAALETIDSEVQIAEKAVTR